MLRQEKLKDHQSGQGGQDAGEVDGATWWGLVGSLRELLSDAKSCVGLLNGFSQGRDMIRCASKKDLARRLGGEWMGGELLGAGLVSRSGSR